MRAFYAQQAKDQFRKIASLSTPSPKCGHQISPSEVVQSIHTSTSLWTMVNRRCESSYTDEIMGLEAKQGNPSARTNGSVPASPIPQPPPAPVTVLCVHGWNPKDGQCWECLHRPNRKCAGCG